MASQIPSDASSDREGDTFEDASDMTSRPASESERSRSRSLTKRRTSTTSTAKEESPDSRATGEPASLDGSPAGKTESNTPDSAVEGAAPDKSPLLTAHRISVTSDMDDVSLEEEGNKAQGQPPKLPPREPSSSGLRGFSGKMSPVNYPPPPPPPPANNKHTSLPTPTPTSSGRKFPFWFGRSTSEKKPAASPPLPASDRRNTNASIATISSNPELTFGKSEENDGSTHRSSQSSLRDRFNFLRRREEGGVSVGEEVSATEPGHVGALAGLIGRTATIGLGVSSPGTIAEEKEGNSHTVPSTPGSPHPGSGTKRPTINPLLAPGTASGIAAGPGGDAAEPVDWDLWQSVVYEGPAAVARTSPEELNRAIASGIPQAIRGVVWQVLAESKNDDLESMYRELVARGTDKEHMTVRTPQLPRSESNSHLDGSTKEKESIASSSSSVHSDASTPATTSGSASAPMGSPPIATDPDAMAKEQARLAAERKQKADEVTAIHKLEKTIRRDLGARTSYSKYVMAAGLQDGLFGICKAYALFDETVGYAQGMNFIAMPLLFNMPEEEAFCLFVRLMNKYGLRDLFIHDMPGLHLRLYQFERLLEDLEPALYCHLRRREVRPQLYATQWFLTLFAYRFPLQLVLRIYDLVLSEGLESAILKFGIVLMQKNAATLLGMKDMSTLTTFLKERVFDVYIDKAPSANSILESGFFGSAGGVDKEVYRADKLVQDAVAVKVTSEMLKQYTAEWKIEKEREAEFEAMKDKVTHLEGKVRRLEYNIEERDTEQVQVANQLLKTQLENERLQEDNETLRTKVEELQKIVETQPQEVEMKLKADMEVVMQRNITVHNENRALEDQMAEMEKELVATKLQWAEINSEHETLKQKWNNISQLMNK